MTPTDVAKAAKQKEKAEQVAAVEAVTAPPEEEQDEGGIATQEEATGTQEEPQTPPSEDPAPLDELAADETSVPRFAEAEEQSEAIAETPAPGDEPLPREYVVLNGPSSYGPVRIGGRQVRVLANKLYYVADVRERATILGTGRFRAAKKDDLARSAMPSSGPGGALTRDMLPPGALKGGLVKP